MPPKNASAADPVRPGAAANPVVIAHRGASGYCVEHSEAAKALAHAQPADFIEQDVVLTKDEVFVVSHDITMEATTDVAEVYPDRKRDDGKYYWADFTWEELAKVSLRPRSGQYQGKPVRGAGASCGQRILRLEQEIELLRALDLAFGKRTGLYVELKSPAFHRTQFGKSMGELLLAKLREANVPAEPNACLIQCFESDELVDLKTRLDCPYPLIQLLGGREEPSFEKIATYAFGVGPSLTMLAKRSESGPVSTGFVEKAHAAGLLVHPYTVRRDSQPPWSDSLEQTHDFLVDRLHVDGFFTDFPDLGRKKVDGPLASSP